MTPLETDAECVLFDLDGTLVDTAPDFIRVLDRLAGERGRPAAPPERVRQTVSDGARALVGLAFGVGEGHRDFDPLRRRLLEIYAEQLERTESVLYPGFGALLEDLERAAVPWGVVTNKPVRYARRLLERLGLERRCGSLVCPDHVAERKPSPEPVLAACRQLGRRPERTVLFGDHVRDVRAAKSADAVAVAAAYGYLAPGARVEDWRADFVVHSAGQARSLLGSLKFA